MNHKSLIFHSITFLLSLLTYCFLHIQPARLPLAFLLQETASCALVLGPLHMLFPQPSVLLRFLYLSPFQTVYSNITFHPT